MSIVYDSDVPAELIVGCSYADIVIVGGGLSGVAAAQRATELGASVFLFEKCGKPQARSADIAAMNRTYELAIKSGLMDVRFNCPVVKLLKGKTGRFTGVVGTLENGKFIKATAMLGVILATENYLSENVGLESDDDGRCLGANGFPLPGLYFAGIVQSSRFSIEHPTTECGISHSIALTLGYIAAETALNDNNFKGEST